MSETDMIALTLAERRQVAAVIRRVSRRPLTDDEHIVIMQLSPGKHARWCCGSDKRFLRSLNAHLGQCVADAQRRYLWRIAFRYRDRLAWGLKEEAWQRRAWAFGKMPAGAGNDRERPESVMAL